MATPITYTPTLQEKNLDMEAHEALELLVRRLHERGILRLLNNALSAGPELTNLIAELLDREGSRQLIQNITRLTVILGELDISQTERITNAFRISLAAVEESAKDREPQATGISAILSLLRDQELWEAIAGISLFLKRFRRELGT